MAVITKTSGKGYGSRELVYTTLGASDTFVYDESKNPIMVIDNTTVNPITVNIDGDAALAAFPVPGVGTLDLTSGYNVGPIAAGARYVLSLVAIKQYLAGTIAVTGGDGAEAAIIEF